MKDDFHRDSETRKWFGTFEYEPGVDPALAPCPFCGEQENLRVHGVSSTARYSVNCDNCGASSGVHDQPELKVVARTMRPVQPIAPGRWWASFEEVHREGFEQGIWAWNRRANASR